MYFILIIVIESIGKLDCTALVKVLRRCATCGLMKPSVPSAQKLTTIHVKKNAGTFDVRYAHIILNKNSFSIPSYCKTINYWRRFIWQNNKFRQN